MRYQVDLGRSVYIPYFGTLSGQAINGETLLHTQFEPEFLEKANIKTIIDKTKVQKYPSVRLNMHNIAKFTQLEISILEQAISAIFLTLDSLLKSEMELLEVDIDPFGKVIVNDKVLTWLPTLRKSVTVQGIRGGGQQRTVKTLLQHNQSNFVAPFGSKSGLRESGVSEQNIGGSGHTASPPKTPHSNSINSSIHHNGTNLNSGSQYSTKMGSPTRRFKIERANLTNDMLGAGTDPLALKQDFSILANNGEELMAANFVRPPYAKIKCPPILDRFSRTFAAPIGSQYNSFSVSARIALFYTPTAKYLHMDHSTKEVTYLKIQENQTKLTANKELLQEVATEEEEILFVIAPEAFPELEPKVKGRRTCYERYKQYIHYEIPRDAVAPMKKKWIDHMMKQVPTEYHGIEQNHHFAIQDKVLIEINADYLLAVKKAILDYILKDEGESMKVGILEIFNKVVDYGEEKYKGVIASQNVIEHFKKDKVTLINTLNCYGLGTYEISRIWGKIEQERYLYLPRKDEPQQSLTEFMEMQQEKITNIRNYLAGPWGKEIVEVFRRVFPEKKDKEQLGHFFNATSILMHNQMRQLIDTSLQEYREFILSYKKKEYLDAVECIKKQMDANPELLLESSFLFVRVVEENKKIILDTPTAKIKQDLARLVADVIKTSHKLPRAENAIARNERNIVEVNTTEEKYEKLREDIEEVLTNALEKVDDALKVYRPFEDLFSEVERLQAYLVDPEQPRSRKDVLEKIASYERRMEEVKQSVPFEIHLNVIMLDSRELKSRLIEILKELIQRLEGWIVKYCQEVCANITTKITDISDFLTKSASTEEVLVQLEKRLAKVKDVEEKQIRRELLDVVEWVKVHYDLAYCDPEEQTFLKNISATSALVWKLPHDIDEWDNSCRKDREEIEKKLIDRKAAFVSRLNETCSLIEKLKKNNSYFKSESISLMIDECSLRLKEHVSELEEINVREKLVEFSKSEFSNLDNAHLTLSPFVDLKNLSNKVDPEKEDSLKRHMANSPIFELNPEMIEKELKQMIGKAAMIKQAMEIMTPPPSEPLRFLESEISKEIETLQKDLPIVKYLCNAGLQERHWNDINKEFADAGLYLTLTPDSTENLKKLNKRDIHKALNGLSIISDRATKEFTNQKVLDKIDSDWAPLKFDLQPWKETGTFTIQGACVDDLITVLDDHLIKIQTMKGSPYAKPFEERINNMESGLLYIQSSLDIWLKVQGLWIYLEPIFTSDDISRSLPDEHKKFKDIDQEFRFNMAKFMQSSKCMELPKNKRFLDSFTSAFGILEGIVKNLNDYLEKKRTLFPRFYFISPDSLIEILSEVKDPLRVQKYLKNLFEGVEALKFDEEKCILGLNSSESEFVPLQNSIDTVSFNGLVEKWLQLVEDRMVETVHEIIRKSYDDYGNMPREDCKLKDSS